MFSWGPELHTRINYVYRKALYSRTERGFIYGMWAVPRPMTKGWGSGQVWLRICKAFDAPDVAFGKTDGIPDEVLAIDYNTGHEWAQLPFENNRFAFGYWDPPYDKLYKKEGQEIWRVCRKLAVLHTHVYPTSWFEGAKRVAGIGITMGPLKRVRLLQVFEKQTQDKLVGRMINTMNRGQMQIPYSIVMPLRG